MYRYLFVALLICTLTATAQQSPTSVNGSITSEGLYNITDGYINWINLLDCSVDQALWKDATLSVELLSVNNLRDSKGKGGTCDNLNIFSAIEDTNVDLALFMFGITQQWGPTNIFLGVRNVNNDYCTSPWNSMFTASTNGLLPIISHNYPISDSPLSAMALHAEWSISKKITFKTTLYNGVAGENWDERFRFRPSRDGLLSISEVSLINRPSDSHSGNYTLGFVWGNVRIPDTSQKKANWSIWSIVEQPLYHSYSGQTFAVLLQGGIAPKSRSTCHFYAGAGALWRGIINNKDYAGVLINRSDHKNGCETAVEITYSYTMGNLTIQPALHRVFAQRDRTILMLKAVFDFGLL